LELIVVEPLPRIAIITINWNRPNLTKLCYEALLASEGVDWHLFIVDNGSTDDSVSLLSNLGHEASLISTGVNSGWAGGNNRGIKAAQEKGFEWFLLLNNDATVSSSTILELWRSANSVPGKPAVVGAVQMDTEESGCFFGTRETETSVFPVAITQTEFAKLPELYPTSFVKGAALFCHESHILKIGLFDERFFLNYEETDWCKRARNAGFSVLMAKRAKVEHSGSGSMGGLSSPISTYFLVRNALLYAEMHNGRKGVTESLRISLGWARNHFGTSSSSRAIIRIMLSKSAWATAWKLGIRDYFLRRFGDCPQVIRTLTYSAPADII
jgi:GT2 family glycosyltransferase